MTRFDQILVGLSLTIGLTTAVVKLITFMADHHIGVLPIATITTVVLLARTWSVYRSRWNKYLADLTQTLYFKSMANNRALLTLVVDRAEDEAYKAAMLAYSFIRASSRLSLSEESPSDEECTDGITKEELRAQIEGWMENKFGLSIDFDPNDCISFLEDVGILSKTQEGMARKYVLLHLRSRARILQKWQKYDGIFMKSSNGYDLSKNVIVKRS